MRGLIGGIAAGAVTAVLGFAAVSLLTPLPDPAAPGAVPVGGAPGPGAAPGAAAGAAPPAAGAAPAIAAIPAGSQFDSAGSIRAPELGQPASAPVAAGAAPPVSLPASAASGAA
ncbi:MAG: hypothetical protein IE922_13500, partial [Sphingomonadales bacterium]|nr:hypothetical protein [Sphingomonadales bacterium]